MKIAFILESSYNSGGMERMLSCIVNALSDKYSITVISAFNAGRPDYFPLNKDVERIDLGITNIKQYSKKGIKQVYFNKLNDYLMSHHQDVCVSLGSMEFFFLPKIKDGSKKVFWYHFALSYDLLTTQISTHHFVNNLLGYVRIARRIFLANRFDKIVCLSKQDEKLWKRYLSSKKITQIYNPVTVYANSVKDYAVHRVLSVGRLDRQKGYDFLIKSWAKVHEQYPDWTLDIYGEGEKRKELEAFISQLNLGGVVSLKGRSENLANDYSNYSFYVMSSRYEGFPLVLLEAASAGLPLVAYDCPSGPSEIVKDGYNGYLAKKVGDIDGLAEAIDKLVENEQLRRTMGANAKKILGEFELPLIVEQWKELFSNFREK